ncbi:MAG: alginate lyase family protein [Tannerella sp.]|nr:alginate lyase family protein [Tannerella sp.]
MASQQLNEPPATVTAFVAERSAGGIHDFFSEGDYWWPDPENPNGPYIQKDGETNPDNFVAHRHAMIRFSMIVGNLTSAYLLTRDTRYIDAALRHIRAWFINEETKMNPNLLYAQAIKGIATGRGIGIIDTIHFIEVVQSLIRMEEAGLLPDTDRQKTKKWFSAYLEWISTHPYGIKEMNAGNNHATCWAMQAAIFAKYTGNETITALCTDRFKNVFLSEHMADNGSFPREINRTKPYGYSLFNLDAMATLCHILSDPERNLWNYTAPDGKCVQKGIDFLYPYVADKNKWPYKQDVMYWDEWPVAHPFLLFGAIGLHQDAYLQTWTTLEHFPTVDEVLRNLPIRNPLIWLN